MVALTFEVEERIVVLVKKVKWLIFVEPCAELVKGGIAEDELWRD